MVAEGLVPLGASKFLGITYEGETVLEDGLQAGETVVTDGQLRLAPGAPVSVKSSIEAAAPATATNAP